MNQEFWKNRKVLVTGHTGFKGGWLSLWLSELGARVFGYSLEPPTDPSFFKVTKLYDCIEKSEVGNVCDLKHLSNFIGKTEPEVVFHLAAQPLVRYSYVHPVETFQVNVLGTVNLYESLRVTESCKCIVNITTDKCYENREWIWPYRETEPLGGYDPYSSSKACSELVTSAYRRSYFEARGIQIATARAGNVIGGGDWSKDRLIPDIFSACERNQKLIIRSPEAIRPWQHVLEPLSGYIMLAEQLFFNGKKYSGPWNFGPNQSGEKTVSWIADFVKTRIESFSWESGTVAEPHEAKVLKLDSSKARSELGWIPNWSLEVALHETIAWHESWKRSEDMYDVSRAQIARYLEASVGLSL